MSAEENKRLIRHFFDGVIARDMGAFEVFAADAVHHNPFPGTPAGQEGNKQGMMLLFAAFPDWQKTIEDLIAEGDKVGGPDDATWHPPGNLLWPLCHGEAVDSCRNRHLSPA